MTISAYKFEDIGKPGAKSKWRPMLLRFISHLTIDSKETGVGPLVLYSSQKLALEQICEGMTDDVRAFVMLKARQMGISTLLLAIDLFWVTMFPGTQGALVVDDDGNRDQFRNIIVRYIESLPAGWRPKIKRHNRYALVLANGSVLHYLVAGTKKKGSFGQGRGLNFVHATELSRYGDAEAWASFVSALAEQHPNRLFVYESTARGYNLFADIWEEAVDSTEKRAIFLSWWTKETYRIKRSSRQYKALMEADLTDEEKEKIALVKEQYGVEIDDEQVAWYRAKSKELMSGEMGFVEQEFPWTAEDAFQLTGRTFFPRKQLNLLLNRARELPFRGYRYSMAEHFDMTQTFLEINTVKTVKEAALRVWEEPSPFGTYSVGADPAYGSALENNNWRDLFAINVIRCYADRVVQVAEYAANDLAPHQFAWTIAHLCGWYRNTRLVLEMNGPGGAVLQELKHVQNELRQGHRAQIAREKGINNILGSMSHYLYHRQDSLGSGYALHFMSTQDAKAQMFMRFKDAMLQNRIDARSVPMLTEMGKVVSDSGTVGAEGRGKDDRTFSFALGYRGYDDWIRAPMTAAGETFAVQMDRERKAREDAKGGTSYAQRIIPSWFKAKAAERAAKPNPGGAWRFEIRDKGAM